jgi:hypothetical protein
VSTADIGPCSAVVLTIADFTPVQDHLDSLLALA